VLPDGSVSLIFTLDQGGGVSFARGPLAFGHDLTFNATHSYVVVRLRAGVAAPLFQIDAASLAALRVPLTELPRSALTTEFARLDLSKTPREVLSAVGHCLVRNLESRQLLRGTQLSRLATHLETVSPPRPVAALATVLRTSERTLRRRMLAEVGLTPKRFLRALRVRRALALLSRHGPSAAASVAVEVGYADQAHMCRDFDVMLGCGPSECLSRPVSAPLEQPLASFPGA
jgi:AraC-like DNA-binding protein